MASTATVANPLPSLPSLVDLNGPAVFSLAHRMPRCSLRFWNQGSWSRKSDWTVCRRSQVSYKEAARTLASASSTCHLSSASAREAARPGAQLHTVGAREVCAFSVYRSPESGNPSLPWLSKRQELKSRYGNVGVLFCVQGWQTTMRHSNTVGHITTRPLESRVALYCLQPLACGQGLTDRPLPRGFYQFTIQ